MNGKDDKSPSPQIIFKFNAPTSIIENNPIGEQVEEAENPNPFSRTLIEVDPTIKFDDNGNQMGRDKYLLKVRKEILKDIFKDDGTTKRGRVEDEHDQSQAIKFKFIEPISIIANDHDLDEDSDEVE